MCGFVVGPLQGGAAAVRSVHADDDELDFGHLAHLTISCLHVRGPGGRRQESSVVASPRSHAPRTSRVAAPIRARDSAGRYGRDGQGGPAAEDERRRVWCWDSPFPLVAEVWMMVTSHTAVRAISRGTEPSASPSVAPRPRLPTTIRVARFWPATFS